MLKKIYLFCPSIHDGGLEKTLSIYANFLSKHFKVTLVTNTFNKRRLKIINRNVKIINFKNKFFLKNRIANNLFCILKIQQNSQTLNYPFSDIENFF